MNGAGRPRFAQELCLLFAHAYDGIRPRSDLPFHQPERLGFPREKVVICTKAPFGVSNPNSTPETAVLSLERSLKELGTDYIDVYQLHGVAPRGYDHALQVLAPALLREKEKGKFRHLGITETAPGDPGANGGDVRRKSSRG